MPPRSNVRHLDQAATGHFWPIVRVRHDARKRARGTHPRSRRGQVRSPSAPSSPVRHPPQSRGIAQCLQASSVQAATGLHADSSCACRSALLWFSASSACRRRMDQARQLQPSDALSWRTGELIHEENGSPCLERGTDHRVAGTFPAKRTQRFSSIRSVRTALAAGSSSGPR